MISHGWNLNHSFDTLEIPPDATLTKELVEQQFRKLVRDAHPDMGGDPAQAPERVKALSAAKKQLLAFLENYPQPDCFMCGGRGTIVKGPFSATEPCPRCSHV